MTAAATVATMKAAQVTAAGAGLKIVELEIPDPGPEQVRIKVQACGVCHVNEPPMSKRTSVVLRTFMR